MNKIKQIFLVLSLACMAATAPLCAMNENSEQLALSQSVGQSLWNSFFVMKTLAYYGVSFVGTELRCLPDVINSMLMHITSSDEETVKEHTVLRSNNSDNLENDRMLAHDLYTVLFALKNRAMDGAGYAQNGLIGGVHYAHNTINEVLVHMTADGE